MNKTEAMNAALTTLVIERTENVMIRVIRGAGSCGSVQAQALLTEMAALGLLSVVDGIVKITESGESRRLALVAKTEGYRF